MNAFPRFFLWYCFLIGIVGCGTTSSHISKNTSTSRPRWTLETTKKQIKPGSTTQLDVMALLKNPHIFTRNRKGNEVWTYLKQDFNSETQCLGGNITVHPGKPLHVVNRGSRLVTLVIEFDQTDVVKRIHIRSP